MYPLHLQTGTPVFRQIVRQQKEQEMPREVRAKIKDSSLVEERRELIVKKGISLFLQKGYHKTTAEEIAKACSMSPGSLYRYIGSKEDIPHLQVQIAKQHTEILQRSISVATQGKIETALTSLIAERIKNGEEYRLGYMFVNRHIEELSSEDREAHLQMYETSVLSIANLLIKGIESGIFRVRSPLLLAHEIVVIAQNWGQRKWFLGKFFTREEYTKLWTENILNMILVDRNIPDGTEVTYTKGSKPAG